MSLLQASEDEILIRKFSVLCRKAKNNDKYLVIMIIFIIIHHRQGQTNRQTANQPARVI